MNSKKIMTLKCVEAFCGLAIFINSLVGSFSIISFGFEVSLFLPLVMNVAFITMFVRTRSFTKVIREAQGTEKALKVANNAQSDSYKLAFVLVCIALIQVIFVSFSVKLGIDTSHVKDFSLAPSAMLTLGIIMALRSIN